MRHTSKVHHDIQSDLGTIGRDTFQYEFYITNPNLDKYKFRIMFIEFGSGSYPVNIILEQGIYDEIFSRSYSNYEISFESKTDFANAVEKILESKRVLRIMQDIINAVVRKNYAPAYAEVSVDY